jgi:hypothetical protein
MGDLLVSNFYSKSKLGLLVNKKFCSMLTEKNDGRKYSAEG